MAEREEVGPLIATLRGLVGQGLITFVPRDKNREGMIELGINEAEREAIVGRLTVNNYSGGPEDDRDGSGGQVWIFGASVGKAPVYIKLKVEEDAEGQFVKCLSFHPAEHEMTFPLRASR